MTYSPHGFCRGLEGGMQTVAMTAVNAARAEREIDRSDPLVVARLGGALRAERRRSTALAAELALALKRLASSEDALSRRTRR